MTSNINLLKSRSALPEYYKPIENQLRSLSMLVFIASVAAGLLTFLAFATIEVRFQMLSRSKDKLIRELEQEKTKESLFLVLKSRISVIDKVLEVQKKKSTYLVNALSIAPPPSLLSLGETDEKLVTVSFEAPTMPDASMYADRILRLSEANKIRNVRLTSFSVDKNGVRLTFSYLPVWE